MRAGQNGIDAKVRARRVSSSPRACRRLTLFGGEVTATNVSGHAQGTTSGQSATGSLAGAAVTGLTVGGVAQAASPNGRVALGDWGYAITLEQADAPARIAAARQNTRNRSCCGLFDKNIFDNKRTRA